MRRTVFLPILALCLSLWALSKLAPLHAQGTSSAIPKDTILEASTNTTDHYEIWQITPGKAPTVFALMRAAI